LKSPALRSTRDRLLGSIRTIESARRAGEPNYITDGIYQDGQLFRFDLELTRAVSSAVGIPVIASGGVGELNHLVEGVTEGHADAVLAASIFHFGQHTIQEAKQYMHTRGVCVRLA
jgi:cyclase